MSGADIRFEFESTADESRFLREYLADAWDRYRTSDYWETGWFWAYRQYADYDVGLDGGLVVVVFEGDPEGLVDSESDRWASFDGLGSWDLRRYEEGGSDHPRFESLRAQQHDVKGEKGGNIEYRLKPLASRLALAYLAGFDDPLPMVGEATDDNPAGVGFWGIFHYLAVQCGYDHYAETDACLRGIRSYVQSIAQYRGVEDACEEYERIREEVAAMEGDLESWFETHPTGEGTVP
jgi:hypothetical protein